MKKYQKVLFIFLAIFTISFFGFADADSGWDSSYDGGSSWSEGDSSSDSSSNWNDSSSNDDSGGGSGINGVEAVLFCGMILTFIVLFLVFSRKNASLLSSNHSRSSSNSRDSVFPCNLARIKEILPEFDREVFQNEVFDIYKKIQIAWMDFDYDTLRDHTTDELYNMYYSQLEALKIKKHKNIMSDFDLHDFEIVSIDSDQRNVSLKVRIMIECYDYVVDENNNVVRGVKDSKNLYDYEMIFIKGIDSSLDQCPSCGASLPDANSVVCPYCKSTIVSGSHGFVLAKKRMVRQKKL